MRNQYIPKDIIKRHSIHQQDWVGKEKNHNLQSLKKNLEFFNYLSLLK